MVHLSTTMTLFALPTFLLPAFAAPTRTLCRCTIINTNKFPSSLIHSDSTTPDICADLGPELDNFRHSQPDLYETFVKQGTIKNPTPTEEDEKPLSTTVLLRIAAENGFANLGTVLPSAPTERPRERIICRSEPEAFSTYEDSRTTLFALQVILGISVFACIAEGISYVAKWLKGRDERPALRLSGTERLLRAHPPPESIFSPGVEKKLRAYEGPNWSPKAHSEKREFGAYDDDEDDEMNRPVM